MSKFINVSHDTPPIVLGKRKLKRRGIVIHETIGIDSLAYLQGGSIRDGRRVSADFLIGKTGFIWQITPPGYFAFGSGIARWRGYQEEDHTINQGFYQVELENDPNRNQVIGTSQYIALAWLIRRLCTYVPIDFRDVIGHYQCALPVGRKTDPISLNWPMLTVECLSPSKEHKDYTADGELS